MRNKAKYALLLVLPMILTSCVDETEMLKQKKQQLQADIQNLQEEKEQLQSLITQEKIEKDVENYIITFELKQTHYTLDLFQHAKDEINKTQFDVIVSKEYYDSLEVGDVVSDDFRVGSAVLNGSYGKWKVSVLDKRIE